MIDFVALVGKITGKAPTDGAQPVSAGQALGAESGIPIGGEFAALVRLAAQAEASSAQGKPRLVVDNGGAGNAAQIAATTLPIDPALIEAATGDGEIKLADEDKPREVQSSSDDDAAEASLPLPSPAAAMITPLVPAAAPMPPAALREATQGAAGQQVANVILQTLPKAAEAPGATPASAVSPMQPELPREIASPAIRQTPPHPQTAVSAESKAANEAAAIGMIQPEEAEQAAGVKSVGVSAPRTGETVPGAPAGSSLRTIVEGLPPVIQSQLSDPAVRAVTGPSTGEALGDHVIDMGVSGQWIDRMAREIAGLVDGSGHSRFTLSPPHLGRLQVDLWRDQDATNVRLTTETDEAAQRLAEGRPALQADARIAALAFGSITIEKGASSSFDTSRDQNQSQNQGQQRDLSGQTQQQADSQAQARRGNAQSGDWMSRSARNDQTETSDAPARPSAERTANGRIRFA
jgi:flagellar hook-length control protein FliK